MNRPEISVVIPVYNAGAPLREAIDSALAQQNVTVEIIVMDDGSTCAETRRIIDSYADRILCLRQENAGVAVARNQAVRHTRYNWIAFLDQDDIWVPEKLELQVRAAEESGVSVVYTNAENFGELERVASLRIDPEKMPVGDVFEQLLLDNFITMSSVMIRKSVLLDVGGFCPDVPGLDDWELWLKLSCAGEKFFGIGRPLTLYRWHSGSQSRRHHQMKVLREKVLRAALKSSRGRQVSWQLRRQALSRVRSTSAWFIAEKEPMQAAVWYAQSLALWPLELTSWKGLIKSVLGRS